MPTDLVIVMGSHAAREGFVQNADIFVAQTRTHAGCKFARTGFQSLLASLGARPCSLSSFSSLCLPSLGYKPTLRMRKIMTFRKWPDFP